MQSLLASLSPAILKLGVKATRNEECLKEVCCVMLVFYFSLSHGSRSSLKRAEWSLSLTSLLPKLHSASKGYRSKGPSVLPVGLGNKWQRPFKRERGREPCRCEVTVSQPGPWEPQPAQCRGLSTGLICGFWKRNTLLTMDSAEPPSPASWAHRELSLFSWTFWSFVIDFTPVWSCLYNSQPHWALSVTFLSVSTPMKCREI